MAESKRTRTKGDWGKKTVGREKVSGNRQLLVVILEKGVARTRFQKLEQGDNQ